VRGTTRSMIMPVMSGMASAMRRSASETVMMRENRPFSDMSSWT